MKPDVEKMLDGCHMLEQDHYSFIARLTKEHAQQNGSTRLTIRAVGGSNDLSLNPGESN